MSEKLNTPIAPTPGAMTKPSLSNHKKYKSNRVRYAIVKPEGGYAFCFTSSRPGSESGKNNTRACTRDVYEKVYGRHPGDDADRTPVGGYANYVDRVFYVYENIETGVVEAISVGPGHFYNSKQNAPVLLKDRRVLETVFYPDTGSFEVQYIRGAENEWQLPAMPGDTRAQEFDKLVAKIDAATELYPGQQITPEFRVSVVAGNHVSFAR